MIHSIKIILNKRYVNFNENRAMLPSFLLQARLCFRDVLSNHNEHQRNQQCEFATTSNYMTWYKGATPPR